ncbi:MAG: arylamine N-acetyltransferase [Ignavibacteriaceae bacterium]|nr:arylamine N-acetyltransferase [Ignavibacteriaceae bacterium]
MTDKRIIFDKYLSLLEQKREAPSVEYLHKIVKSHLIKIPFENISKLLLKQKNATTIPDLVQYLEGIEKYNFGGTCYSNNYYLYLLLQHLGFEVKLCGCDMKNPDVHLISIVTIDNREFIVDGGYAAPFLEPMPRDLKTDYVIELGNEQYILKPKNDEEKSHLEQYHNGELKHWYTAKPQSRNFDEFEKVIRDSYADKAMFMNAILITRFFENGSIVLRNLNLTETIDGKTSAAKIVFEEIPELVNNKFGIPAELVRKAISKLSELKDTLS